MRRSCRLGPGGCRPRPQPFIGAVAVDHRAIFRLHRGCRDDLRAQRRIKRPQLAFGRPHQRAFRHARNALVFQERGHRLSRPHIPDRLVDLEPGVRAISFCRLGQIFLILGGKGAQGVLHPVAQLAQNNLGHIRRILRDEIDPDPFGPDQPRHLFHLGYQRLGRVGEQKMRLVKKEHQLGAVRIANLWQGFEQFRQQPQQEGRV